MQETASTALPTNRGWISELATYIRVEAPSLADWCAAGLSSILLIVSFPDFDLWPLAWVALVPLLVAITLRPVPGRALILGWLAGSAFFYGSCHWLTFSMVHYGGLPSWAAYLLLVPGAFILGLFPGGFAFLLARAIKAFDAKALMLAPFAWAAIEWARLAITGQLWNALGYSQAYHPLIIQPAQWGGVYAVSFVILSVNAAITYLLLKRTLKALAISAAAVTAVAVVVLVSYANAAAGIASNGQSLVHVVALQPNVPMDLLKSPDEIRELTARHVQMSAAALQDLPQDDIPRLVIWPESPMNFTYAGDAQFRELVSSFGREHKASILFNSQEPASDQGTYNSALLVNEAGRLTAQYDKIRLLPFGEYVPLPRWLPGATLITTIVGDFTAGRSYTLMPVGAARAGVFICIESAYPFIARRLASEGADVLINISNDGYLGRTAVMRQHLANAVFRAVENERPLLRVTNTGITAYVSPTGEVKDATESFQPAIRTWSINRSQARQTWYSRHGDLFALASTVLTVVIFAISFIRKPINR